MYLKNSLCWLNLQLCMCFSLCWKMASHFILFLFFFFKNGDLGLNQMESSFQLFFSLFSGVQRIFILSSNYVRQIFYQSNSAIAIRPSTMEASIFLPSSNILGIRKSSHTSVSCNFSTICSHPRLLCCHAVLETACPLPPSGSQLLWALPCQQNIGN